MLGRARWAGSPSRGGESLNNLISRLEATARRRPDEGRERRKAEEIGNGR
jgi:hypothetical protein